MELTELAGVLKSASSDDSFDFCEVLDKIAGDGKCHDFAWCDDCKKFIMDSIASELEKSKARLMPEGMEWPRFEDGEPVAFGDEGLDIRGNARRVNGVRFTQSGFVFISDGMGRVWWANDKGLTENPCVDPSKRVKRPEKVLDAGGVEIRVGDTVWHVKDGSEMTAHALKDGWVEVSPGGLCRPDQLTHRAPVLAADGKPLREGETVYLLHGDWCGVYPCYGYHGGEMIKVVELHTCHLSGGLKCENDTGFACYPQPSQLTHECPDSWDLLAKDAEMLRQIIATEFGDYELDEGGSVQSSVIDLVNRAKALAEWGQ